MTQNFFSNYDGDDDGFGSHNTAQNIIVGALLAVIVIASIVTTFGFFAEFAPNVVSFLDSARARAIASGIFGVLLLDIACLGWALTARRDAPQTMKQISIANGMSALLLLGAVGTSIVYILLSTTLVSLSGTALSLTQMFGTAIMLVAVGANFVGGWLYTRNSVSAEQKAEAAKVNARIRARVYEQARRRIHEQEDALAAEIVGANMPLAERRFVSAMTGRNGASDVHVYNRDAEDIPAPKVARR